MKKSISTLTFLIGLTLTMQGQTQFKFGATGGLLHVNANFDLNAIVTNYRAAKISETGFYIGALADIAFSERFHLQPEVTYGSAGDLSFVYVPVIAKVYVFKGFNVQFGPQFNFNSNISEIKDLLADLIAEDNEDRFTDSLKSSGFDIAFGLGYDINDRFALQARYGAPLTNRYAGPFSSLLDIKNSSFNLGIAFYF